MSIEKYIYGKADSARHVGRIHNVRALQETEFQIQDFWRGYQQPLEKPQVVPPAKTSHASEKHITDSGKR